MKQIGLGILAAAIVMTVGFGYKKTVVVVPKNEFQGFVKTIKLAGKPDHSAYGSFRMETSEGSIATLSKYDDEITETSSKGWSYTIIRPQEPKKID